MQLADVDAVLPESGNDIARFLEFHRQMAGVVVDPEMGVEPRITRTVRAHCLEELDRLRARFQITQWLRLQSKV